MEKFQKCLIYLSLYDKEGLLPDLQRDPSGIRRFNEQNIETLRLIECLKKSGMSIKDIKEFMRWCSLGDKTIKQRYNMFLKQKEQIESEMKELEKALDMIKYKCWYYEEAMKDGNKKRVKTMTPDQLPKEIKTLFEQAHQ